MSNAVNVYILSPPKVLDCVEGCDKSKVAGPVFVLVVLVVPQRPFVLQWMFDEQLWVDDLLAGSDVFCVSSGLHLQRSRCWMLLNIL